MTQIFGTNKGYIFHEGKIQFINIDSILYSNESMIVDGTIGGAKMHFEYNSDDIPTIYKTEQECAAKNDSNGFRNYEYSREGIRNSVGDFDSGTFFFFGENGIEQGNFYADNVQFKLIPNFDEEGFGGWKSVILGYDTVYSSYKLAEAHSDIEVIENDGSKHTRPSLMSQIALSDEQKKVFDNLKKAFEDCKNANIKLFQCCWRDALSAINDSENIDYELSEYDIDNAHINVEDYIPYIGDLGINTYSDCEAGIFIKNA